MTALCESDLHLFGPFAPAPPAEYVTNWHGCATRNACADCLQAIADAYRRRTKPIPCDGCGHEYPTLHDYLTWSEL